MMNRSICPYRLPEITTASDTVTVGFCTVSSSVCNSSVEMLPKEI